jgi:hypothetical protein
MNQRPPIAAGRRSLVRNLVSRPLALLVVAACLAAGLAVEPAAAAAQGAAASPPTHKYTSRYRIFHLNVHTAEVLAWEQIQQKEGSGVVGSVTNEGTFIDVQADAATHERIARALAREDAAPRTQVFQILLLSASGGEPAQVPPDLPAGARKALQDLQGFLPYKSYRLLDSNWVPATSGARSRLVGAGGASYETDLRFKRTGDSKSKQLFVETFRLVEEPDSPALVDAKGQRRSPRQLIATSFDLDIGETIVVGTSRVDGADDQALVVLVTAVAEPSS